MNNFDFRFYCKHVENLITKVFNEYPEKDREKIIKETIQRVSSQIILRSLSCIQIASKMNSHNKVRYYCFSTLCLKVLKNLS